MKKNIFTALSISCFLLACVSPSSGQSYISRFSIGAELALPTSTYGDQASTGFGGSLRYEVPLGTNFGLMLTAGYLSFGSKSSEDASLATYKYTYSIIPIQPGLKFYLMEQQKGLYIDVEGGVHLLSSKSDVEFAGITTSSTYNKTAFSYAPGVGYHFGHADIGVKYQMFSESTTVTNPFNNESITSTSTGSYFGLRVAYVF